MSLALASHRPVHRRWTRRTGRILVEAGSLLLGAVLLIWWLLPIYNMVLIALDSQGATEFAGYIIPPAPSLEAFKAVLFQGYWYLEDFWRQFGNSIYIGCVSMALTVAIGSAASFALGRLRRSQGWVLSNAALLIYAVPAFILVTPFYRLMHAYKLMDSLWSIIGIDVVFSLPCTLLVLLWYGRLIPIELDDAARIDGASPWQVYSYVYLPLMAPALAAVGTYALLLAWNEYLYQFLLLSSRAHKTVAITMAEFFENDDSPWNFMMAAAVIYSLPPIAVLYALRRFMATGLTLGAVKG